MKSIVVMLMGVVLSGCAETGPGRPPGGTGGHNPAHPTVSTGSTTGEGGAGGAAAAGVGGAGGGGESSSSASSSTGAGGCDPKARPMLGKCGTVACAGSTWIKTFVPEDTQCSGLNDPWAVCDGAGNCVGEPPPSCGVVKLEPPAKPPSCDFGVTSCDDGNECTFDACVAGVCTHTIFVQAPVGGACQLAGYVCDSGYCCSHMQP